SQLVFHHADRGGKIRVIANYNGNFVTALDAVDKHVSGQINVAPLLLSFHHLDGSWAARQWIRYRHPGWVREEMAANNLHIRESGQSSKIRLLIGVLLRIAWPRSHVCGEILHLDDIVIRQQVPR